MIRSTIRRACQLGLLGFSYPSDFPIKTCLRWRMLRYERATVDYLKNLLKRGDVFIDVGAHIGYYARYASSLVGRTGRVFAFEPHPSNYSMLVHNCRQLPQIESINAAVSDSSGQALLYEHSTSGSSHAFTDISGSGKTIPVRKLSLDEWVHMNKIHRVDVILVDVEGHEISVLYGMRHIIENNPNMTIIMEYCPSNYRNKDEEACDLIKSVQNLQLYVTCALGQSKKYTIPEYKSCSDLKNTLSEAIEVEFNSEGYDYVNIVIRRQGMKPTTESSVNRKF